MEGDFEEGSPITTAASGDILDTLKGLFSSDDTDPNFQAMLTDVANQELVGPPEQGVPLLDPNTGEYTYLEDPETSTPDLYSGAANSLLGPSYRGDESRGTLSPNYAGLVEMRGQDFYDRMSQPQTSGNFFIDGAANLVSGIGQSVTNSLSGIGQSITDAGNQIKGLFSGDFSNLFDFDFDYTPSIDDRTGPLGPFSGAATAFMDDNLSTDRKIGQVVGGVGAGLGLSVMPGGTLLGLLSAGMTKAGAHHDFNPSTDYNLNFDTRSGRTDWGSLSPGAGGSQYGSLNNENMIEDIAKDNPDYEIQLDGGKGGYITAEQWVDVNNSLKNDPFAEYINPSEAFSAFADSPGDMFQSFGGGTLGEALTEFGQTGTGAIMNEAGAIGDRLGLGYNETSSLADEIAAAAEQGVPMGLLGVDALDLDMSMGDLGGSDSGGDTGFGGGGAEDFGGDAFGDGGFGYY
jgi:hypothetical protein